LLAASRAPSIHGTELAKPAVRRDARYLLRQRTLGANPGEHWNAPVLTNPEPLPTGPPSRFSSLEMCYVRQRIERDSRVGVNRDATATIH
jgi:hypothetical protein